MKVLQVNCVYKKGSTGKIVADIHSELLCRGYDSVVCYGRGAKILEHNVYKTCPEWYSKLNNLLSRFTGLMYGGCFFSTLYLLYIIKKERPDVVHLHCLNGYFVNIYKLISWMKKNKIKTVLTLHAEFMHTANCGYAIDCERWKKGCGLCPRCKKETKSLFFDRTADSWKKMKKAFDNFDNLTIVSVSPWLYSRAKQSPIMSKNDHLVIFNGVDTEIFRKKDKAALRKKYGLQGKMMAFHVTSFFSTSLGHLKGGAFVVRLAQKLPDIHFYVAGAFEKNGDVPKNIHFMGRLSDQNLLADYYAMADFSLIVSEKETFSMPVAESLCCGTPVVGFKAGGPESICPECMRSNFFNYGDLESLVNVIKKQNYTCVPLDYASCYSKENMTDRYIRAYVKL